MGLPFVNVERGGEIATSGPRLTASSCARSWLTLYLLRPSSGTAPDHSPAIGGSKDKLASANGRTSTIPVSTDGAHGSSHALCPSTAASLVWRSRPHSTVALEELQDTLANVGKGTLYAVDNRRPRMLCAQINREGRIRTCGFPGPRTGRPALQTPTQHARSCWRCMRDGWGGFVCRLSGATKRRCMRAHCTTSHWIIEGRAHVPGVTILGMRHT